MIGRNICSRLALKYSRPYSLRSTSLLCHFNFYKSSLSNFSEETYSCSVRLRTSFGRQPVENSKQERNASSFQTNHIISRSVGYDTGHETYPEKLSLQKDAKTRITFPTKPLSRATNQRRDRRAESISDDITRTRGNSFDLQKSKYHLKEKADSHDGNIDCRERNSANKGSYNYGLSGPGKVPRNRLIERPVVRGEILYGLHPTLMSVTSDRRRIHKLYVLGKLLDSERPIVSQLLAAAEQRNIPVESCDRDVLNSLCQARPHQGVCADVDRLDYEPLSRLPVIESTDSGPQLWIILDSVQDPMNFGAILRSSYFLGVDQVFVVKENSCSMSAVVSKASAGVMEITKLYAIHDTIGFIKEYQARGWSVFGTGSHVLEGAAEKVIPMEDCSVVQNTIVILGNEGAGLSKPIREQCDGLLAIQPGRQLHPSVDSLNVSVATGILLHHLCTSRS